MHELPVIALKELAGNDLPHLNYLQELLVPYLSYLISLWWFVWIVILVYIVYYIFTQGTSKEE